jgi:hypothetical protein
MPNTLQALVVLIVALLPGALYTRSFERLVGAWGVGFADRVLRFVGASAVFQAVIAPFTVWGWRTYIQTGRLQGGDLSVALWLVPLLYVAIPIALGVVVGRGTVNERHWSTAFTGPSPAPRAWDHLFGRRPDGWVRLRLKSGVWLGGAFTSAGEGLDSYAAGYPDEQDLFLAEAYSVDPETGEFELDANGDVVATGSGILVRWAEVEYLDFIDA